MLTFCQRSGILASYIASKDALNPWLITMVPSMASFRSDNVK